MNAIIRAPRAVQGLLLHNNSMARSKLPLTHEIHRRGIVGADMQLIQDRCFFSRPHRPRGRRGRGDDFIDVEVVDSDSNSNSNMKEDLKPARRGDEGKGFLGGLVNVAKNTFGKATSSLARVFGGAEDEATKRKRERQQQLSTEIDTLFKGSGLAGGLIGSAMKAAGGMLLDSMQDTMDDVEDVQRSVRQLLENDDRCNDVLGSSIRCYAPTSTASSSSNINGNVQRSVTLTFPVQGNAGAGQVQVQAAFNRENNMRLINAMLRTQYGTIQLRTGGGNGGGNSRVIDAEIL